MTRPDRAISAALAACACAALFAPSCGGGQQPPAARQPPAAKPQRPSPRLSEGPVCRGSGAHDRHAATGLDCAVCHPCGGQFGFSAFTYPGGTSPAGGQIVRSTATSPATCTVACHSPFGAAPRMVAWTTPGPLACGACHDVPPPPHPAVTGGTTRADCEACHQVDRHSSGSVRLVGHAPDWMSQSDPGFHAFAADRGLGACQQCHLPDLSGGVTGVSCASCHDRPASDGGVVAWQTNCVMCHGGTDNLTGAPPRTVWGYAADSVRTGAHSAHVSGSALAPPFDCDVCHVKPADALAAGHIDAIAADAAPTASVKFAGLAAQGTTPAWDRSAGTCSSTYCHGGTLAGGATTTPAWTAGQGQAACGACHGLPPPAPHPLLPPGDLKRCSGCHPFTVDPAGSVIAPAAGGKHLDGLVEAVGGHSASWMDPASAGFHAPVANSGLSACTGCHGADLTGGSAGVACGQCHDQNLPPGVSSWKVNCVMCHGGVADKSGAPPRATWGNEGDPLRVGAHTVHRSGRLTPQVDCATCHLTPADALSPGHVDRPTASVTFAGRATEGGATPSFARPEGTCSSTYCHGNYSGVYQYEVWDWDGNQLMTKEAPYAGKNATPLWTGAPVGCDSCHGNPPATGHWHSPWHGGGKDCQVCHPDARSSNGVGDTITNPALHINGKLDIAPVWVAMCLHCH